MKCSKLKLKLSAYADNELTGRELEGFREHLRICPECSKELENIIRINNFMAEILPEKSPEGMVAELNGKLNETVQGRADTPGSSGFKWNYLLRAAVSFAVILTAVLVVRENSRKQIMVMPGIKPEVNSITQETVNTKPKVMRAAKNIKQQSETKKINIAEQDNRIEQNNEVTAGVNENTGQEQAAIPVKPPEKMTGEQAGLLPMNRHLIFLGYSLKNDVMSSYNSFILSILYVNSTKLHFGMDVQLFNFHDKEGTNSNQLGFFHIGDGLISTENFITNWYIGMALTTAKYMQCNPNVVFSNDLMVTLGAGIFSEYALSGKCMLYGRIFAVNYPEGYLLPFQFGPVFSVNRFSINTGIQGVIGINNQKPDKVEHAGLMFSLGYIF